jgi:hypothetical protein
MSTTVIDAFVTTLGLDGTLFKRGMKEAQDAQDKLDRNTKRSNRDREKIEQDAAKARAKRQKEADEQGKKTLDNYKKIRNELLSITAIFTAGVGIKDFLMNTINTAANLGYLSQNLRMTTQQLTSWQRASERAGGSAEGIVGQLKESADTLAQLRSGFGPNEGLQNFFRFGGSADDLKDGNTYLLARSRIIANLFKKDPAQAALISKQMGISEDQFNFLKQGPDAVMKLVQAQEKNAVITAKDAEEALKLKNRLLDLRDSLVSTGTRIAIQLIPVIDGVVRRLESMSQWVVDHKDDIARWIDNMIVWIKDFAKTADSAADAVGGWKNVLVILAGIKVASTAASLVGLAASLLQIGTGLASIAGGAAALPILAGLAAIVVGGAAGYGAGKLINRNLSSDTKDAIGKGVATVLAAFGVQSAQDALDADAAASVARRSGSGKITGTGPRGMRNNNPGNLEYGKFAIANGAIGSDGRFARFASPEAGISAMSNLLRSYGARGINSINGIINRYAPGNENNVAAYIADVAKRTGFNAGAALDLNNPAVMQALVSAMIMHENGRGYSGDTMSRAIANARAVGSIPTGNALASMVAPSVATGGTSTTDVKIDNITINTGATDAQGIATAIRPAIEKYTFATQANTGVR